jgi:CheY-like chemotaxis protein
MNMDVAMEDLGTVLIVDDSPSSLQVLGELLGHAGYKVRSALSGEIALHSIEFCLPDLVLLDVRLPGIDGYETCRRLYADDRTHDIPVIFVSALSEPEDIRKAYGAGGVDFVTKPFPAEQVLALVQSNITRRRWLMKASLVNSTQ